MLEYAATSGRILLTQDKQLVPFVIERIDVGKSMPGVFVVHQQASLGHAIDDLVDLTLYSLDNEWDNQIVFVPLPS